MLSRKREINLSSSYKNMVYPCNNCLHNFDSPRRLNIHRSHCKSKNNVIVRNNQIDMKGHQ